MDRNRFSAIAHRNHAFSNPISEEKLMKMVKFASLKPNDKVIDVGAGKCELLIRLVEEYKIKGLGIELYDGAIEEAKSAAKSRIPNGSLEFLIDDANSAVKRLNSQEYIMGLCIGSTHALGGLKGTLQALKDLVSEDGYILVGEGYWKQTPSAEYLLALGGANEDELQSHYENVRTGEELGLTPLWSYVASEDEWDDYEWLYSKSVEDYCHEHPEDRDREAMLERIRNWRSTYLRWGRDTLGFGLYLFRK